MQLLLDHDTFRAERWRLPWQWSPLCNTGSPDRICLFLVHELGTPLGVCAVDRAGSPLKAMYLLLISQTP
jgi:hypothetical protein